MTLPLDTAPGPSPDAIRNAGISQELLTNARLELDAGDLLQASDKAWGAAAFAVKAVAEKRRWFNDADWKLEKAVGIISTELNDSAIRGNYQQSRNAHYNFYHHEYSPWQVANIIAGHRRVDCPAGAAPVPQLHPALHHPRNGSRKAATGTAHQPTRPRTSDQRPPPNRAATAPCPTAHPGHPTRKRRRPPIAPFPSAIPPLPTGFPGPFPHVIPSQQPRNLKYPP